MIRIQSLFMLVFILGAGPSHSAEPSEAADSQSTYEPRSSPGDGQKFLAAFVGEWDVTKKFYPRTGDPVQTTGSCHQRIIHDGRFLKSEFVFDSGDHQTTGTGVIGCDAQTNKFTSFWIDSRSTRFSVRQSKDSFDGKEIVLYSRSLAVEDRPDGAQSRSKTVTHLEVGGRKIVHRQYTLGSDNEERLVMELVLTRKVASEPKEQ